MKIHSLVQIKFASFYLICQFRHKMTADSCYWRVCSWRCKVVEIALFYTLDEVRILLLYKSVWSPFCQSKILGENRRWKWKMFKSYFYGRRCPMLVLIGIIINWQSAHACTVSSSPRPNDFAGYVFAQWTKDGFRLPSPAARGHDETESRSPVIVIDAIASQI